MMTRSSDLGFIGPARTLLHTILWTSEMLDEPGLIACDQKRAEYEAIIVATIAELSAHYDRHCPPERLAS